MSFIIGFFRALLGKCDTKPLAPDLWKVEQDKVRVNLDKMSEMTKGSATYLQGQGLQKPILVLRTQDGAYLAFTNRCSHANRKLDPVPGEPRLRCCSVMHSTFDYEGKVLSGPAKQALTRHEVSQESGELVINV